MKSVNKNKSKRVNQTSFDTDSHLLVRLIIRLLEKIKAFLFGREALIFLLFCGVASGFWLFQHLHRKQEYTFRIPLTYRNIPLCCVSTDDLPTSFEATLRDVGIGLISYRFSGLDTVVVDLSRYYREGADRLTVPAHHLSADLRRQLAVETEIVKLGEAQLIISLNEQHERTVPVRLQADITYAQQHQSGGEITLEPSLVTIYGAKSIVDTLVFVETQRAELRELNKTTELFLTLRKPKGITVFPREVRVRVPVETFTEQTAMVAIRVRGVPEGVRVYTFPAEVRVTYFVGLSRLEQAGTNSFEVWCDYSELARNSSDRVRLTVLAKDLYLTNIRLAPEEVEYLIEK